MDKKEVIEFFDAVAPHWDDIQLRNEDVIRLILDMGGISKGKHILDVACGTGVLFPDYISLGADVTGIDISAEMVKKAKEKFRGIEVICSDAESYSFEKQFDAVMIYNAFPHFTNPKALFENLTKHMKKGGRLSVAHGISEKELEKCHSGTARNISLPLPSKEKLSEIMSEFCDVDIMVSDERMYMVSGVKI
ncbi:MAG: methyltransferase domain-containing protein [Acutalibacteraceae bacterium]|nr:methyltransferase domain-containing protein [Acutalibacteraceae bacterium]